MNRPNIVLIGIDTLRPDHLGCYGYRKPTSPHIDSLAAKSVVFERAFAPGIPTMPSFTTLLTGLHPYRHGITAHSSDQRVSESIVPLPQRAKNAGYVTIGIDSLAVQANGRGAWFPRGFDYYSGYVYKPFSNQSEQLVDRAIRFITDFREKPFLLFMHLWDPHSPYGPPSPYDTLHYDPQENDLPDAPKLSDVKAISQEYYEAFLDEFKLKVPDDYAYVVAQYDGEISYVDAQIGRVIAHLKDSGLWENTVVVLMSDHGECFGEGSIYFDHHSLYDANIRVALMCRAPGMGAARRERGMVATDDILPTLAELCGWEEAGDYSLTGRSFVPALRGEGFTGRDQIVGVESTRQASLCLRTERWKLIQPIVEDVRGQPLTDIYGQPRDPALLLFDLESDPQEKENVADRFSDVRDDLLRRLSNWRAAEVARRGGSDPIIENGLSLSYDWFMARLRARRFFG